MDLAPCIGASAVLFMKRNREYRSFSKRSAKRSVCSHWVICLSIKSIRPHASLCDCKTKAQFFPVRTKVTFRDAKYVENHFYLGVESNFIVSHHRELSCKFFYSCLDRERKRDRALNIILICVAPDHMRYTIDRFTVRAAEKFRLDTYVRLSSLITHDRR